MFVARCNIFKSRKLLAVICGIIETLITFLNLKHGGGAGENTCHFPAFKFYCVEWASG